MVCYLVLHCKNFFTKLTRNQITFGNVFAQQYISDIFTSLDVLILLNKNDNWSYYGGPSEPKRRKQSNTNFVQLCPVPLRTPPLLSSIASLTITGLCHSDFEFKHTSASHLFILTASFTCLVSGSLKVLTTFMLYPTSRLPPWWLMACFQRGESSCLPWYLARWPSPLW